ncbi:SH3 domain-containing protein [Microbacterium abyssi]|uniref:SH3 domain-containing protein n=1 Tax=Microbacterium abyssi TaxID=2782166 RepID=UPI001886D312|nr:SH3 domain-containing protein [Microbacterium sp. A18JL241]
MSRRVARSRSVLRFPRFLAVFVAVAAVVVGTVAPLEVATASASVNTSTVLARSAGDPMQSGIAKTSLAGFKAGNIISDAVFTNNRTMTEAQIQSFFNSKVSKCVVGKDEDGKPFVCLKDFKITSVNRQADAYCSGYKGAANESAARIIYRVAQACDINPQVLIVMLQKEQGLVTHVWPSAWRYNIALGQGCPDTAPCDPNYIGFFHQIYGAARQMQIYMEGKYFQWYAPGKTWGILYHPNASCGRGNVYVANKATAALYYYTPYQPNAAAMRANYGEGDGCSSYGNRNFYNYFTDWFGSTQTSAPSHPECTPPAGGTKGAKYAYVVTADSAAVRTSARNGCDLKVQWVPAGTVIQAVRVTAAGDWLQVKTEWGKRWIKRKSVERASAAQAECTMAAAADPAKLTYVITSQATARLAPRSGCTDAVTLEPGAAVRAVAVSKSGLWLKVRTESGNRWILRENTRKASSDEARCVVPNSATAAKYAYVALGNVPLRTGPDAACDTVGTGLAKGAAVRAVSSTGGWLKVIVGDSERWVDRNEMRRASTAEGVCVPQAGQIPAVKTYITTGSSTARIAPNTACSTTASTVKAGTIVQAVSATAERDWLLVDLGTAKKWLPRGKLAYATQADRLCSDVTDVTAAKYAYVTTRTTAARTGPADVCANGGKTVAAGQVVRAVGGADDWLLVRVNGGESWIKRSDTRRATTAEAVCVPPSVLKPAKLVYVVSTATTGRIAPDTRCAQETSSIRAGVTFTADLVTADKAWLHTTIGGREVWVPRGSVRKATTLELQCPVPSDTKSAHKAYVVLDAGATARKAPTTDCDIESSQLKAGTLVTAAAVTADGAWLQVDAGSGPVWISRADVRYATSADTTCKQPSDATAAKLWYRTSAVSTARVAPSNDCTDGAQTISSGSVFQAVRVNADWLELRVGTSTRWLLRSDLEKVPTATTTTSLNVRASASTSSPVVVTLAQGTLVAVLAESGEWWQVQTAGGTGWVKDDFLR